MAKSEEYKALEREYRRLASKADARLRALESYQHDKNYKPAIKWAYARAQKDIEKWGGNKRFNTAPPSNINSLKAKIADINTFIDAPTSTKRGITSVYKQRAETLNKNYGTNYTWRDMATFFESETYNNAGKFMGSTSIQRAIAKIQENPKDIIRRVKESGEKVARIDDDLIKNQAINDLIKVHGLTEEDLRH